MSSSEEKESVDQKGSAFEQSLITAFEEYDKDGNKQIDRNELKAVLSKHLNIPPSEKQIQRILDLADKDGDGQLNFEEFKTLMAERCGTMKQMLRTFMRFDTDKNHKLSKEELLAAMKEVEEDTTMEDVEYILKSADIDGDGEISFTEFIAFQKIKGMFSGNNTNTAAEEPVDGEVVDTEKEAVENAFEESLVRAFKYFDKDGNNLIDPQELKAVLEHHLKRTPTERQVGRLMQKVDIDHDGKINFEEFKKMMHQRSGTRRDMLTVFRSFDKNGDHSITKDELIEALNKVEETSKEEVDEILKLADLDEDGKINFDEFLKFFV
eukprot:augustus_masked-scaffold_7-processed-gene-6.46-mRNA-1 protein AED:0.14 eAED:0.21 QI:0/0/0/1/1/1/2/0/322